MLNLFLISAGFHASIELEHGGRDLRRRFPWAISICFQSIDVLGKKKKKKKLAKLLLWIVPIVSVIDTGYTLTVLKEFKVWVQELVIIQRTLDFSLRWLNLEIPQCSGDSIYSRRSVVFLVKLCHDVVKGRLVMGIYFMYYVQGELFLSEKRWV